MKIQKFAVRTKRTRGGILQIAAAFALASCIAFNAQANPLGGQVTNGSASFNTSGNTFTVTNSPGTIINWQGFSINANEATHFAQQSAASTVLNRVVTNAPSEILGKLSSNGQVFLINPSGIVFGAGSTIDVAGMVATSLNLSDADFLAGRHSYTAIPGAQNISNAGSITAKQGGQIFLIAPNVENTGVITSPNGEILLAAGNSVELVNSNDPSLRVSITAPAGDATNVGQLIVGSGSLGLFGTVVKNTGTASADSATVQGGKIVFKASQSVIAAGTVSANSTAVPSPTGGGLGRGNGGSITLQGAAAVAVGGTVSADGVQGGSVAINAGSLSMAGTINARGTTGQGGSIDIASLTTNLDNIYTTLDASGATGGSIRELAGHQITSSAKYLAVGNAGIGGHIDISAPATKLLSVQIDVSGLYGGGQVRIGGEYQGGKLLTVDELPNAQTLAISAGSVIKADATVDGNGGTVILWSDTHTALYADVSAQQAGAGSGGFIELSSADQLTWGGTANAGVGGNVLMDPKNIVIQDAGGNTQYNLTLGFNYSSLLNSNYSLEAGDLFGTGVSLNGTQLVVGASNDDGFGNTCIECGAVYLFNNPYTTPTLSGIMGKGYTGVGNYDVSTLEAFDHFGHSSSLFGTQLAVGAFDDGGFNNTALLSGAVYLFNNPFSAAPTLSGILGKGYTGAGNFDVTNLGTVDSFGGSVALTATQLVVGAFGDDGVINGTTDSGAVYLFNTPFTSPSLYGIIGKGYTGAGNFDVTNLGAGDTFGDGVSFNGNQLVVGASRDDGFTNLVTDSGAAYLFNTPFATTSLSGIFGNGYTGLGSLNITTLVAGDFFGNGVSLSGTQLAVGAYGDDGFGNAAVDSGAVYLINNPFTSTPSLYGTIGKGYTGAGNADATNLEAGDAFGAFVSLSGTQLVVGAPLDGGRGNAVPQSGAVYLINDPFTTASLYGTYGFGYSRPGYFDVSTLDAGDNFGNSVSLFGTQLAVGANFDSGFGNASLNSGAVYLFNNPFTAPTLSGIIGKGYTGTGNLDLTVLEAGDGFGHSVSLYGTQLVVGANLDDGYLNGAIDSGAVYLINTPFSAPSLKGIMGNGYVGAGDVNVTTVEANDRFGASVSLFGSQLVVGSPRDDGFGNLVVDSGAVYLYNTPFTAPSLTGIMGSGYAGAGDFNLSTLEAADRFGSAVSLSSTGTQLAVGALLDDGFNNLVTDSGAVYLFNTPYTAPALRGIIGSGYVGANDFNVTKLRTLDYFGDSVSLDGTHLAVGATGDSGFLVDAPSSGAVYLINNPFTAPTLSGIIGRGYATAGSLDVTNLESLDYFGRAVSLSGTQMIVGAYGDSGFGNVAAGSGAVYLFGDPFTTPGLKGIIGKGYSRGYALNSDVGMLEANDQFGYGVSLLGSQLAVGAIGNAGFGNTAAASGAVYLFNNPFTSPTLSGIIGKGYTGTGNYDLATLEAGDAFGAGLSLYGTQLVVGAKQDDGFGNAILDSGAVYLFDTPFGAPTLKGTIGYGYTGINDFNVTTLEASDRFGASVSLYGSQLVVGAPRDDGALNNFVDIGAAYLFSNPYSVPALNRIMGKGYTGGGNVDITTLEVGDGFGVSVSLFGTQLAVAAYHDDGFNNLLVDSGAIYLFDTPFTAPTPVGIIGSGYVGVGDFNVSNLKTLNYFGDSVSLNGTGLAVGATGDAGFGNVALNSGAVYLINNPFIAPTLSGIIGKGYTGAGNADVNVLEAGDSFGRGVSLYGTQLVVGANIDAGMGNVALNSGAVYLVNNPFTAPTLTGIIGRGYGRTNVFDLNLLGANDYFGTSVSLNGTQLAVGAFSDSGFGNVALNSGAVYLFNNPYTTPTLSGIIGKGYSGTGNFDLTALEAGDAFGRSVALTATNLFVGANQDDGFGNIAIDSGAVYRFSTPFGSPTLVGIAGLGYVGVNDINISNLESNDRFGASVSVFGNQAVVGAARDDGFGNVAVDSGAVYLFDNLSTTPTLTGIMGKGYIGVGDVNVANLEFNDRFGSAVSLSGTQLAVGAFNDGGSGNAAPGSGAVYLFNTPYTAPTLAGIIGSGYSGGGNLNLSNLEAGDGFGESVSLNGTNLAVGASCDAGFGNVAACSGAVYLFNNPFTAPTLSGIIGQGYIGAGDLNLTALQANDFFGRSVSLSGTQLAVGADSDAGSGNTAPLSGAVYLFTLGSGSTDPATGQTFAFNPSTNATITPASITAILNTGSALTLQANNDITIVSAIIANNLAGNGGALTLQAGRSILVNANINTDGGALTLTANHAGANVTYRDAGTALLNTSNATITAGAMNFTNTGGDILVGTLVSSGNISLNAGTGTLTNSGSITSTVGASGIISLIADKMVLNTGSTVVGGAGSVGVFNFTQSNAINLGSTVDTTANTLELSNTELSTISTSAGLRIGSASNTGAINVSAPLTLSSLTQMWNGVGGISVDGTINSTLGLWLETTGTVSQTAAITAPGLILNGTGTFNLNGATNSISTIAGNVGGVGMNLLNGVPLTVGTITVGASTFNGITATGQVTLTAPLITVNQLISSGSTTGGVLLVADEIIFGAGGSISAPSGYVLVNPLAATTIDLGTTTKGTAGTLQLSNADLGKITAGQVIFAIPTGGINVTAALTTSSVLRLLAGGDINVNTGANISGGSDLGLVSGWNGIYGGSTGATLVTPGAGNITLNSNVSSVTMGLLAGGNINQVAGTLSASGMGTYSSTGQTLNGANTLGGFSATNLTSGNISLTNTATTLTLDAISNTGGGSVTVNNSNNIAIAAALNAGTGNVNLIAGGAISENTGVGSITTSGLLTTNAQTGTTLGWANAVNGFAAIDAANVLLINSAPTLTLGAITTGGTLDVENNGALTISAPIAVNGLGTVPQNGWSAWLLSWGANSMFTNNSSVTLAAGGNGVGFCADKMTLSGGSVSAPRVILNTSNPLTLTNLGSTGKSAIGTLELSQADIATITSPIFYIGVNNNMNITAPISYTAGDLYLWTDTPGGGGATGSIGESAGGTITANKLITSAVGGITLNGANAVGSFSATNITSGNISLTNTATTLTLNAISNTGGGSVSVNNSSNIAIAAALNAGTGNVNLTAGGAISENTGVGSITTTGLLTTNAQTGTTLDGANAVSSFAAIDAANVALMTNTAATLTLGSITTGGTLAVNNFGNLTVNGPITINGTGVLPFGAPSVSGVLQSSGGILTNNGSISLAAGGRGLILCADKMALAGGTITSPWVGLNTWNTSVLTNLGSTTDAAANTLEISNSELATITSPYVAMLVNSAVNITAPINLGTSTFDIRAWDATWGGGAITETGTGTITAGALITTSLGGTTLNGANAVGSFSASNITSGNISLVNTATTLTLNAISNTGGGSVTVNNSNDIVVAAAVNAGTGALNLTATRDITENAGGSLVSNGMTLSAGRNLTLTTTNSGASLATWRVGQGGTGGVMDFSNWTIAGGTSWSFLGGAGSDTIQDLVHPRAIVVSGANSGTADGVAFSSIENFSSGAGNVTVNFASVGSLSGTLYGGGTGTATLSGTTAGAVNVTGNGQSPLIINALSAASMTASGTASVAVNGALNTGAGAVNLTSAGAITESGSITSGSLITTSVGGTTLNGANAVGSFTATNTGSGAISLTNTIANLALSNISQAGGGAVTIANSGNIALNSGTLINAGAGAVTLAANAGNFSNTSGSATPITGSSIQIWSTSPANNVKGGLVPVGSLFNCTYAGGCGVQVIPASGLVFLYSQATAPTLSITANTLNKTFGQVDPTLTYLASGFVGDDTSALLSGALSRVAGENVGTYAIAQNTLGVPAGYGYLVSYTGANFTIDPMLLALSITANNASKTYGTTATFAPTAFTSAGLQGGDTITGVTMTSTGAVNTANAGTYPIVPSAPVFGTGSAANYTITYVDGVLTVNPAPLTVTATAGNKVYGNLDPTFAYTTGGLLFTDTLAGSLSRAAGENVGSYAIAQGTLANPNYSISYTGANLGITARPISISANAVGKTYGSADALTFAVGGSGLAAWDTNATAFTGALTRVAGETVAGGPYAITQGTLAANSNYNVTGFTGNTLTISPALLGITANGMIKVYGDSEPSTIGGYTITSGALVGSDALSGFLARTAGENVGTYAINQGTLDNPNYTISYTGANFGITPRPITLSVNAASKTYGGVDNLSYAVGGSGLVFTDALTGTLTRVAGENVGSYAISQGTLTANANYAITFVGNNLTINPALLSITVNAQSKVYGNADPTFSYSITSGTLVGSDTLAGSLARTAGENVGSYGINLGTLGNSNYALTVNGANLDITARPITIIANAATKVYGSADNLSYTVGGLGLANGDTNATAFSGALTHGTNENVGTYSIAQGSLASSNYSISAFTSNDLVITPAQLAVVALPATKVLGTIDPLLKYTVDGLKYTDSVDTALVGYLARDPGETIGNYTVNNGTLALNSANYSYNPATDYTSSNFTILAPTVVQEITQTTVAISSTPMVTGNAQLSSANTASIELILDAPIADAEAVVDNTAAAEPTTANATVDKKEAAEVVAVAEASTTAEAVVTKIIPVCR